MNVGASSETDYGFYFQWGDTQGYTASQVGEGEGQKPFVGDDYKWVEGGSHTYTKYNDDDGKTVLDLEDDAARANWGGEWRMPTTEELQALGQAVNAVRTTNYNGSGVNGILCTDKTDSSKTLFFPAASFAYYGNVVDVGVYGFVWSSSLFSEEVRNAWLLYFDSGGTSWNGFNNRVRGYSVRGVVG